MPGELDPRPPALYQRELSRGWALHPAVALCGVIGLVDRGMDERERHSDHPIGNGVFDKDQLPGQINLPLYDESLNKFAWLSILADSYYSSSFSVPTMDECSVWTIDRRTYSMLPRPLEVEQAGDTSRWTGEDQSTAPTRRISEIEAEQDCSIPIYK
eukprot:gene39274-51746_t